MRGAITRLSKIGMGCLIYQFSLYKLKITSLVEPGSNTKLNDTENLALRFLFILFGLDLIFIFGLDLISLSNTGGVRCGEGQNKFVYSATFCFMTGLMLIVRVKTNKIRHDNQN